MAIYAQIKDNTVKKTFVLNATPGPEYLVGYDEVVRIDNLSPVPGVFWTYLGGIFQDPFHISTNLTTQKAFYLANGELDYVEYFASAEALAKDCRLKIKLNYDANLNPITETWTSYSALDGQTPISTRVITHVWAGDDVVQSVET